MGLSVALNNALSGMRVGHNGLDVLSRNVANSGTPGYHRQSLSVIDTMGVNSSYARNGVVTRAFNKTLQEHYTRGISDSGFYSTRATFLDRFQSALGKPGQSGSLDTAFIDFRSSLSALATSTDNYATRADAVAQAQGLASTLNDLSSQVQSLRRETEAQIATGVNELNQMVTGLERINLRLADSSVDATSRATLMDQRDRLVSSISEVIDVRAEYRTDGTVAIMTRSGVGILDNKASIFEFQSSGSLSATSQFNVDPTLSSVGRLMLRTPSGLSLDLVQQNVIKSGQLGALVELRDQTLVQAQDQLDEIAAALAQSMSTMETAGTAVSAPPANGYEIDIASIRNGNDFVLNYTRNGVAQSLKVIRVDDTDHLPMDIKDASGQRVIGLDFSTGAPSMAAQLQTYMGGSFAITSPAADVIRVMDDGAAGNIDITSLSKRTTITGLQGAGLGLSLFVDSGDVDFTNALDGNGQKLGFASRIAVNSAVLNDNRIMVQYTAGGSMGDDDRANYLIDRLESMQFSAFQAANGMNGALRLAGNVGDIISQTINFQGNSVAAAIDDDDSQALTIETLTQRMDEEYGVDVDEEMARLMELQNAFAANARILSTVQDLLDQLLQI